MRCWRALLLALAALCLASKDPYDVLGVDRAADEQQIKQAYKRLVKQWHPDKNKSPDASRRFVEINDAYQRLAGPKRRDGGGDQPAHGTRFADFGRFGYQFAVPFLTFSKYGVDLRAYTERVLPDSKRRPYLIIFYSGMCFACVHLEPVWEQAARELKASGFGVASVNVMLQRQLADELQVRTVPSALALFGDDVQRCALSSFSVLELLNCGREVLPANLISPVRSYEEFRSVHATAIGQNRVTVVFFLFTAQPTLAQMVTAARYGTLCRFVHVQLTNSGNGLGLQQRFGQLLPRSGSGGSLVIFKESLDLPVLNQPLTDGGGGGKLDELIAKNSLLNFPRISSQVHFDTICSLSAAAASDGRQLCAVLLTGKRQSERLHIDSYSVSLKEISSQVPQVSHCYVYLEMQSSFIKSFQHGGGGGGGGSGGGGVGEESSFKVDGEYKSVLLLRRQDKTRAQYRLLVDIWNGRADALNSSVDRLSSELQAAVRHSHRLDKWATLAEVRDENAPGTYRRLAKSLVRGVRQFFYSIGKEETLPVVSVVATFAIIFLFGGLLHYAANAEEQSRSRVTPASTVPPVDKSAVLSRLIRELRAETYFGMVRLLRPGCRTLVVICDEQSKGVLVHQFGEMIWPWRRNKTLMFGYVMAERNLDWFRQLLELTLADASLTNINARNVVGTVLALNGFRQYYCVYHPKYRSSLKGHRQSKLRDRHNHYVRSMGMNGSDITDSSEEERLEEKRLDELQRRKSFKVEELLDGLPNWLDRLFDGDVKRFYISEWPPMR